MKHYLKNQFLGSMSGYLIALFMTLMISACGGGGGSGGTNPNATPTPVDPGATAASKAASVIITTSSDTMPTVGGSVTVNVYVRDANNNVVPGAAVKLAVSSGTVSKNTKDGVTTSDGLISETLTSPGDETVRDITITATVGTIAATPKVVKVTLTKPTVLITTSSGTLDSSGAVGTEVAITVTVKDPSNNVLTGKTVELAADSGALTSTPNRVTDSKGQIKETLSIGGSQIARTIKITASSQGVEAAPAYISVGGHKVTVTSSDSANLGKTSKITAALTDSAGKPMANIPVTFSSANNNSGLTIAAGKSAVTDSQGQVQLDYKPTVASSGKDVITVTALNVSGTKEIAINTINFVIFPALTQANTSSDCVKFTAHADEGENKPLTGNVTLNSSRGIVYNGPDCSVALNSALTLDAKGEASAWVKSTTPGISTLVSNFVTTRTASTFVDIEFVSPVVSTAHIDLQADPAVVLVGKPTTLKAVVRDGTALDNLVKNATVVFSVVVDPTRGSLTQPTVVKTDANGAASVVYTGGEFASARDGVTLQAQIQEDVVPIIPGKNPAQVKLTVSGQSLFISAGTGITIGTPTPNTYSVDYQVFVTDATGNPVNNATISAAVLPRSFSKGYYQFLPGATFWSRVELGSCANEDKNGNGVLDLAEDTNGNGILDAGEDKNGNGALDPTEDTNGNGRLDPGIPITVTGSVTTDSTGQATVTMVYPRDRANWLIVDMTIRARVSGTEATYVTSTSLPGLSTDYTKETVPPPGARSPYGYQNGLCSSPN